MQNKNFSLTSLFGYAKIAVVISFAFIVMYLILTQSDFVPKVAATTAAAVTLLGLLGGGSSIAAKDDSAPEAQAVLSVHQPTVPGGAAHVEISTDIPTEVQAGTAADAKGNNNAVNKS